MSITAQFTLGTHTTAARPRQAGQPARLLLMGDWLGASSAQQALGQRPLIRVDIDCFDALMQRLAPSVDLPDHGRLSFTSLDDFHPDALCQHSAQLNPLLNLYRSLGDPSQAALLIEQLNAASASTATPSTAADSASPFEQLLGGTPHSAPPAPAEQALQRLLKDWVAPHVVETQAVEPYRQAAALSLSAALRTVLRQPALRTLEAHWRGLWWLLTQLDSEAFELWLLPLSHAELRADLQAAGHDLASSAVYQYLFSGRDDQPWTLLSGLYSFSATVEDIHNLAGLATLAQAAGAPLLAAADPSVVGCSSVADLVDPDRWQPLEPVVAERWQALRSSSVASWLCLGLPDVLMRQPYGSRTDAIDSFAFEEQPTLPQDLLWCSAALGLTVGLGLGLQDPDTPFDPSLAVTLADLPTFSYRADDDDIRLQTATAVVLSERAAQALAQRGLTPLIGYRNHTAVRLPGCLALSGKTLSV